MQITVAVRENTASKLIGKLANRFGKLEPILNRIGDRLLDQATKSFDTKTDPAGRPWAGWKTSTASKHSKAGKTPASRWLLVWSGNLRRGIYYKTYSNRVELTAKAPYAKYHEQGTRKMPARRFLTTDGKHLPQGTIGLVERMLLTYFIAE